MARRPVLLVTGASGEVGHGLIHRLAALGKVEVVALDLRPLPPEVAAGCTTVRVGDILDHQFLD